MKKEKGKAWNRFTTLPEQWSQSVLAEYIPAHMPCWTYHPTHGAKWCQNKTKELCSEWPIQQLSHNILWAIFFVATKFGQLLRKNKPTMRQIDLTPTGDQHPVHGKPGPALPCTCLNQLILVQFSSLNCIIMVTKTFYWKCQDVNWLMWPW
jgi:hypothetical protein